MRMRRMRLTYVVLLFVFTTHLCMALSFQQALHLAYQNNPELQVAFAQAEQSRGQYLQNKLWFNPSLMLETENIGGSGDFRAFESAETTLSITQPIPLGGKLHWLGKASLAQYQQKQAAVLRKKAEIYMTVGEAYVNTYYTMQWFAVTKKLVQLNQDIVNDIKRRQKAGSSAELDLRLAQVRLGQAKIQQTRAQREIQKQYAILAQLTGQARIRSKVLDDYGLPHDEISWKQMHARQKNSVFIQEKAAQLFARRTAIISAKRNIWPTATIQLGGRHFSDDNQNALVASIQSSMPVFNRNQGNIHSAEAAYTEALEQYRATKLKLKQQLIAAWYNLRQNTEELNQVKQALLPSARKAAKLAMRGYQKGLYTYIDLSNAMRVLYEQERHYQAAHAKRDIAMIKITGLLSQGVT